MARKISMKQARLLKDGDEGYAGNGWISGHVYHPGSARKVIAYCRFVDVATGKQETGYLLVARYVPGRWYVCGPDMRNQIWEHNPPKIKEVMRWKLLEDVLAVRPEEAKAA